jgi:hypothetical protein
VSERRGILGRLLETGARAASQVARAVADDDRTRDAAAAAVGVAQRGKKRLDEVQERVLHLLGLAARDDYAEVVKRMARLKRKVRELSRKLEGEGGGASSAERARGHGAAGKGEPEEADSDEADSDEAGSDEAGSGEGGSGEGGSGEGGSGEGGSRR